MENNLFSFVHNDHDQHVVNHQSQLSTNMKNKEISLLLENPIIVILHRVALEIIQL